MSEVNSGMPQNTPTGKSVHTRSTFPLQYHKFDTFRFGEYHPHFVMEGVAKDKISFRSTHQLRSYTLKAPLMEDISMKKDYFAVPMTAVLPLNWDKFFSNPVNGQDIPSTDVGPSSVKFYANVGNLLNACYTRFAAFVTAGSTQNDIQVLTSLFRYLVIGSYFYSPGSLLSSLGCNLWDKVHYTDPTKNFDDQLEAYFGVVRNLIDTFTVISSNGQSKVYTTGYSSTTLDLRDSFRDFLEDPGSRVTYVGFVQGENTASLKAALLAAKLPDATGAPFGPTALGATPTPFDQSRLAAYQLVCSQFYTNDQIDYVFDANRYRQLVWYYACNVFDNAGVTGISSADRYFTMNAMQYDYDAFSGHVLDKMFDYLIAGAAGSLLWNSLSVQSCALSYLSALFSFRPSLKFKDYFTGSHAHPLAVADASFDASNTSVIDITKNIQKQRFLNAVNRVGGRIQDYMKEIFNSTLAPDYHDPFYIAHTSDIVYGSEVENTGSDQLIKPTSVTSALRSNGSRYEFTYEPDRDCVLIGITYFDIARSYYRSIDRHFMHLDRFDRFNPYMQFIGDQKIYQEEIGVNSSSWNQQAFAYQLRHMEYKQRYNEASGGFVNDLPGWTYLADLKSVYNRVINSDFIRSRSSELDQFYVSLTAISLSKYFHFIVKNINDCTGSRPMAYAPTIL